MHKLSRTSLAALVCPSAPFLVPRLLRATVPTAVNSIQSAPSTTTTTTSQKSCYATQPKAKKVSRKPLTRPIKSERATGKYIVKDEITPLHKQFRAACDVRDVQHIMDLYPTLLEKGVLDRHDTRQITQALHYRARLNARTPEMFLFVQQVVDHLRKRALEPHAYAFVHLLGIYKEYKRWNEGLELWQWLVLQDETYVSQAAYGAAIDFMAYGRLSALPELEELYTEGLKRFPGTFAEYHLSPDAIVPDRSQPTLALGVPTILLQGILTARILMRDWRRAYLAFDTVLRLFPTQTPHRFFELFITERPVTEAYTALMIACRGGITIHPGQVTALLFKMKTAMHRSSSLSERVMILRAVANALYAYQEAGGRLESRLVGAFIHCFECLLPEVMPGEDYDGDTARLRNIIVITAHQILSGLLQAGLAVETHPFGALVSLAGTLRVPDLLTTALNDIATAKLDLGPIGTRSALTSAGLVKNTELIHQLWSHIVSGAEAQGAQIAFEDWITFTKACRRAGLTEYFQKQLSALSHTTTESVEQHLVLQMSYTEQEKRSASFEYMSIDQLQQELDSLKEQMKNVEAVLMSGSPLDLRTSPFYMHLDPCTTSLSSLELLKTVYDELTTDPYQPAPSAPVDDSEHKPILSSTGIPLEDLRFMNWLSVLEMMDNAEEYESRFQSAVNVAIKDGNPFNEATVALLRRTKRNLLQHRDELRNRIRELRNANAISLPAFRKIGSKVSQQKFKPMDYDETSDKWTRSKIIKYKASESKISTTESNGAVRKVKQKYTNPTKLTYYVGLESHHDAPMKSSKRIPLSSGQDSETGERAQSDWPLVGDLNTGKSS